MESLRKVVARVRGHFVAGKAVDLVMSERLVEVETLENGHKKNFYIPFILIFSLPLMELTKTTDTIS